MQLEKAAAERYLEIADLYARETDRTVIEVADAVRQAQRRRALDGAAETWHCQRMTEALRTDTTINWQWR